MARKYRVSFFKRLADSTGHMVDACQATVEVLAPSKQSAIAAARRRFAEDAHVGSWSLRADYETAEVTGARTSGLAQRKGLPGHAAAH